MSPPSEVVLFDFFGTIGSEVAASREQRLEDFLVYPSARRLLATLGERARLGVFSLDPAVPAGRLKSLLAAKALMPPIDPELVGVARRGDERPFERFVADPSRPADGVVFGSRDAAPRTRAQAAGLRVAPHPALAAEVLAGESLHLVRVSARAPAARLDWATLLSEFVAVPVLVTREPDPVAYAIASRRRLHAFSRSTSGDEFDIQELAGPEVVAGASLIMLHVTREEAIADQELADFVEGLESSLPLAYETPHGWLVALPAERSLEELHPPPAGAGHGHSRLLLPDLSVLKRRAVFSEFRPRDPSSEERRVLGELDAAALRRRMTSWFSHARKTAGRGGPP